MPLYMEKEKRPLLDYKKRSCEIQTTRPFLVWRVWEDGVHDSLSLQVRGPFASSPAEFVDSGNITYQLSFEMGFALYTMTSKGLCIKRPSTRTQKGDILFLGCSKVNGLKDYKLVSIRPILLD